MSGPDKYQCNFFYRFWKPSKTTDFEIRSVGLVRKSPALFLHEFLRLNWTYSIVSA